MSLEKFWQSVVYPIPPAFEDTSGPNMEKMDHKALAKYLDALCELGAKVVMTTAGTSRFNLLTEEEIHNFNLTVNKFKGTRILAFPPLATRHLHKHIVEFSQYLDTRMATFGVSPPDAVMLMYPDRHYSDDDIVRYFHKAADLIPWPVMFHGMWMRAGRGGMYQYTPDLCAKIAEHKNIVGMKEESLDLNMAYNISKIASDEFVVIPAGGSCRRFILCHAAGAQTFLGGIGNYIPEIEESFFQHCKEGRSYLAAEIVREFEDPFMEAAKSMGWHKFLQHILHLSAMLPSCTRPPFSKITKDELRVVTETIDLIEKKLGQRGDLLCHQSGS